MAEVVIRCDAEVQIGCKNEITIYRGGTGGWEGWQCRRYRKMKLNEFIYIYGHAPAIYYRGTA